MNSTKTVVAASATILVLAGIVAWFFPKTRKAIAAGIIISPIPPIP
jgi:hypothetical protein